MVALQPFLACKHFQRYPYHVDGMQSKMARAALGWSTTRLAKLAGVSRTTVFNFETGATKNEVMLERIEKAFSSAGVKFRNEGGFLGVMVPASREGEDPASPATV